MKTQDSAPKKAAPCKCGQCKCNSSPAPKATQPEPRAEPGEYHVSRYDIEAAARDIARASKRLDADEGGGHEAQGNP